MHQSSIISVDRYREVRTVLVRILFLNLAVALAKILFGYATGTVSILSDGYHSLSDAASNVAALVGLRVAGKPPDANHPYGHRKFETLTAAVIAVFLLLVIVEVVQAALERIRSGSAPEVSVSSFGVMIATLAVNLGVVAYEKRAGARLTSELLLADAQHTQSDVLTSIAVLGALSATALGYPIVDPVAAIVIVGFIGHAGYEIAREAARVLSDQIVISEEDIRAVVASVPKVLGCHQIRSRGTPDHVFLDLHIWMDGTMSLKEAHSISHTVKDQLIERYPQIVDAVIHIEPPPKN